MSADTGILRFGIVGFGKMGQIRAAEIARRTDARLVAVSEPQMTAPLPPGVTFYDDPAALVASDLDGVFVCTPNRFSPGFVVASLDAGRHVFCEKPPGRTPADIHEILAAEARNPGRKLKFGFNHRYHAGIVEAKRIVDSGRLGPLLFMRGVYGKCGGDGFEHAWRNDRDLAGGGILLDQGIHMLDLFRLFGGEFTEVKSMVTRAYWDCDVEDNAFALLRNRDGRVAMIHSSSTQWKHRFSLEVYMADGYIAVNGILSSTRSYGDETLTVAQKQLGSGHAVGKPREEVVYFDRDPSWELELDDFVTSIRTDTPVGSGTSQDALRAMELVYEVYHADDAWPVDRNGRVTASGAFGGPHRIAS
jgi:predicted dehydrogenase